MSGYDDGNATDRVDPEPNGAASPPTAIERLRAGDAVFGIFQSYPWAAVTELAHWCGYDFVVIDCEHGVVDETAQLSVLHAVSGTTMSALVRLRNCDPAEVARYLDFGAAGVIVPDVRTFEQAEGIARTATSRWTGGLRGDRYGVGSPTIRPLVILLIVSPEGVANIGSILDLDAVDGVIVGSGDLSLRLGVPGDFDAAVYLEALATVDRAVRSRGKILGAKPYGKFTLGALLSSGHRLLLLGRDMPLFRQVLSDTLLAAHAAPKTEQRKP